MEQADGQLSWLRVAQEAHLRRQERPVWAQTTFIMAKTPYRLYYAKCVSGQHVAGVRLSKGIFARRQKALDNLSIIVLH